MSSVSMLSKLKVFAVKNPLVKGMIAYSIIWPTGSLLQQTIEGRRPGEYDWKSCARFSLYGSLYLAPTLYCWVRLSSAMWPKTNLKTGIIKAITEQLSYGPFAMTSFFIGMSLLEGRSFGQSIDELKLKFFPTYKIGICVWPILQTINFSLVPEHNRVLFVSICSLFWTVFLAYMKQLEKTDVERNLETTKHSIEYWKQYINMDQVVK